MIDTRKTHITLERSFNFIEDASTLCGRLVGKKRVVYVSRNLVNHAGMCKVCYLCFKQRKFGG